MDDQHKRDKHGAMTKVDELRREICNMLDIRLDDDHRVHFKIGGETVFTAGHGSPESFRLLTLGTALRAEQDGHRD